MKLNELAIFELKDLILNNEITSSDIVESCLAKIYDRDSELNAWIDIDQEYALEEAKKIDFRKERSGLLHGIPVGMKDIIDVADMPCRRGSSIYKNRVPTTDAHVVSLVKGAGSLILGKTVTTEFASGNPNITRNPHNLQHTPGGSSSGSAAAVADCMVPFAFGTQTAGSMIRPAAYCGIPAIKPSFGTLSRAGLSYVADSLDTIGWFTRDIRDIGIIYNALTGKDVNFQKPTKMNTARIGICRSPDWDNADSSIQVLMEELENKFAKNNIDFEQVEFPKEFSLLGDIQNRLMCKEMTFWLGEEWKNYSDELSTYLIERLNFGKDIASQQLLLDQLIIEHCRTFIKNIFQNFDYIITPSATGAAPNGLASTGNSIFNRMWTMLHLPCIAMPIKKIEGNLPIGVQLIGSFQNDDRLIENAFVFQEWLKEEF